MDLVAVWLCWFPSRFSLDTFSWAKKRESMWMLHRKWVVSAYSGAVAICFGKNINFCDTSVCCRQHVTWISLLSSQCSDSKIFFAPNFRQMSLGRQFLTTVMDHLKPSSRYFVWSLHVSGGQTLLLDFANEDCQNFGLCESWGTYTRQGIQSRR